MKKIIAILLSILMIVSLFASCGGNNETTTTEIPTTEAPTTEAPTTEAPTTEAPTTEEPTTEAPTTEAPTTEVPPDDSITDNNKEWESIISLNNGRSNSSLNEGKTFNNRSVVSEENEKAPSKVTVNVNGENIEFDYEYTVYYPLKEFSINCYKGIKNDGKNVYLDLYEDGTVYNITGLLYSNDTGGLASTEVTDTTTSEDLIPFAKEFLGNYIDISQYEHIKHEREPASGWYIYLFYNEVNGYIIDNVSIKISDKGEVANFYIEKNNNKFTSLNVDKEKAEGLIKQRIKDMYTTDSVKLISYEIDKTNLHVYTIKDIIFLYYECTVTYEQTSNSMELVSLEKLLVPYELVKAE